MSTRTYRVTFTPTDVLSTAAGELRWEIWTGTGKTGFLLASGTGTSGSVVTTLVLDSHLMTSALETRYIVVYDGAANWAEAQYRVQALVPTPDDVLSGTVVSVDFVYDWRDHRFGFIADLTPAVIAADVELVNDRAVARTARFTVDAGRLPANFNIERDRMAIHARFVQYGDTLSFPLGLFTLDVSEEQFLPTGDPSGGTYQLTYRVEGSDICSHLEEATVQTAYTVPQGTNYITAIAALLESVTFPDFSGTERPMKYELPSAADVTDVTPVDFTWPPGTTKLGILNDLLAGICYHAVYADEKAVLRIKPALVPSAERVSIRYTTSAEPRMILPPFTRTRNTGRASNRVLASVEDPLRAVMAVVRQNSSLGSVISTANAQPFLRKVETPHVVDANRQIQVADYELAVDHARATRATLVTEFDPRRTNRETYALQISGIEEDTKWVAFGWRLSMQVGAEMAHDIGRADTLTLETVTL